MKNIEVIFGAPGCGKTHYLMSVLDGLFKAYEPEEVAFVSFTRKGSYEGRDRAVEKFEKPASAFKYFKTLHAIAFEKLGMTNPEIMTRMNYREFSKAMGMSFLGYYTEDLTNRDDKYLNHISLEKNNPALAVKSGGDLDLRKLKYVRANYERYKFEKGLKDYDDLMEECNKMGDALPVKVAIIDEAQDLTSMQWDFCYNSFKDCEMVYIAGDDDQAIYEWAGADVKRFLSIARKSKMLILDKSYRLRQNILELSKVVISQVKDRVVKDFSAVGEGGGIFYHNSIDEIVVNNEQSYYFLSRNNTFLKAYKEKLIKTGMQFSIKGEDFGKANTYKMIMKYEELRKNDPDAIRTNVLLMGSLKPMATTDLPWYEALEMKENVLSFWRNFFSNKSEIKNTGLNISTIHGVKGGEADNVVLSMNVTRTINDAMQSKDFIAAELRCLYVGMTRAKKNLHIVHSNSKFGYESLLQI